MALPAFSMSSVVGRPWRARGGARRPEVFAGDVAIEEEGNDDVGNKFHSGLAFH
jgi:hypothetical protein